MKMPRGFYILFISIGLLPPGNTREMPLEQELRTNGRSTLTEVEEQRKILQKISAVIYQDSSPIANGTVMTPDGYILTKADNIRDAGNISVRIDTRHYKDPQWIGEDTATDLALIKIDAEDLDTPQWESIPVIGTVVVANGATTRTNRRARLGIVSAASRSIPEYREPAGLGVTFAPHEGMIVSAVYPEFAGGKAGMKAGDELLAINGQPIDYPEDVMNRLKGLKPGDPVELRVKRKDEELTLRSKIVASPFSRNDMMSGRFNRRRGGFPEVIQHDIPLSIYNSGGPLITLGGKTIGINIARANRAESFALTTQVVRETFEKMLKDASQKN